MPLRALCSSTKYFSHINVTVSPLVDMQLYQTCQGKSFLFIESNTQASFLLKDDAETFCKTSCSSLHPTNQ